MAGREARPSITTIPSSDTAFRAHVLRIASGPQRADHLEARLRRIFPRVVVRERELSGEGPVWYVYRDGAWRPPADGQWWQADGLPCVVVSANGWITEANPGASTLLGLGDAEAGATHFTDLIPPGTLDDALALFKLVEAGHDLTATILLRPTSGDVIAVDIHASRQGTGIEGRLRLANFIAAPPTLSAIQAPELVCLPERDAAFRGYAQLALSRMPEPTLDGLALRLRRLYPHARVTSDGRRWVARRDPDAAPRSDAGWWRDSTLPRVRYDGRALIFEANDAATALLGKSLIGHHWQEFVTPGSTEQVSAMLAILAEAGAAESRFRMPGADGSLVEFDSYTEVDGETYTTIIRPRR